jgi:hypothetical protein
MYRDASIVPIKEEVSQNFVTEKCDNYTVLLIFYSQNKAAPYHLIA